MEIEAQRLCRLSPVRIIGRNVLHGLFGRVQRPLREPLLRAQSLLAVGGAHGGVGAVGAHRAGLHVVPEEDVQHADQAGLDVLLLHGEGRLDAPLSAREPRLRPDTVRDSIRRHLEPIPAADRELLSLAAVAGDDVEVRLLARALDIDAATVLARLIPIPLSKVCERLSLQYRKNSNGTASGKP